MKPECKALVKAFESISSIGKYYEEDFPEMLSVMYLLLKGYWTVNDDGVTEEVKTPPYTVISLLNAMRAITERIRKGGTIEEIISEQELCGEVERI